MKMMIIWMRRQDLPERGTPIPPDMACVIRNIPRLRRENHLRLGTGIILRFIALIRIPVRCYEDAQEICDQIKTKRPVVVNLEKVEYPIAQRIMDFLSGTCYSLEGSIQRVANNIFIIAPENVDISGDFKEELKTKGVLLPWMSNGR